MRHLLLFSLALVALPASADVLVQITDFPTAVIRYSPVFITFSAENTGREPVLIPATEFTASRYFLEVRRGDGAFEEFRLYDADGGGSMVPLGPGKSWLFRVDIGKAFADVGAYSVRAGIKSSGECRYHATGAESFPLRSVSSDPFNETYQCWQGEARSTEAQVEVRESATPIDQDAVKFIWSKEFPTSCQLGRFDLRLQCGAATLIEHFPQSHYAVVAGLQGSNKCPDCLSRLLALQPNSPLAAGIRLQRALALLATGRGSEVTEQFIRDARLPPALVAFLMQQTAGTTVR